MNHSIHKIPSLEAMLCHACKGDRAASHLATRMLDAQAGADPLSSHDRDLLAWLERRNRRSRRRGGLRAKVLHATAATISTPPTTDPPIQEPRMPRHSTSAVLCLPTVPFHRGHPLDFAVFAACCGNRAAIEQVARKLRPHLVEAVRRSSRPFRQDAEDVVQDLFVVMLERRLDPGPHVAGSVERLIAHAVQQVR